MQPIRLAFMGFRHGHIRSLYDLAKTHPEMEIAAACEEDSETYRSLVDEGYFVMTHDNYARMLDEVPCDAVAIGDYYGKRGAIAIEALRRGKHVISDKPVCTSLEEMETIISLSKEKGLSVGCQLDLREHPVMIGLCDAVKSGSIGEVVAVSFTGQHPLRYQCGRPDWYFEEGKHGGTINDIGIHAINFIPWVTGHQFARVEAARGWNARLPQAPFFQDGGQMMLTLANGAGVLGDVSYFAPDSMNYSLPQYWRITFWGTEGVVEGGINAPLVLHRNGADGPETVPLPAGNPGAYLHSFVAELRGKPEEVTLTTAEVLESSRFTLLVQQAADKRMACVNA
ncbi:MAG: Gfo/Idh/MocA family protein [Armatimonadota bacterium]